MESVALAIAWYGEAGVPVNVDIGGRWSHFPVHSHDFVEIVLIPSGTGAFYDSMRESRAQAGDVYVLVPGSVHGIRDAVDMQVWNVQFMPDPEWLPVKRISELGEYSRVFGKPAHRDRLPPEKLAPTPEDFAELQRLALLLDGELRGRREGYSLLCASLLTEFLVRLLRSAEVAPAPHVADMRQMAAAMAHVEANLSGRLTLASLAAFAGVSESALCRAFRSRVGQSPIEYVLSRRIARSFPLLASTNGNIAEVAAQVGFSDPSYFSRQFRRYVGVSPSEYRQQQR